MEQLINAPMTRKELLTLPVDLRRKIIERQVDKLKVVEYRDFMYLSEQVAQLNKLLTHTHQCLDSQSQSSEPIYHEWDTKKRCAFEDWDDSYFPNPVCHCLARENMDCANGDDVESCPDFKKQE
jgi:hypothetical protein